MIAAAARGGNGPPLDRRWGESCNVAGRVEPEEVRRDAPGRKGVSCSVGGSVGTDGVQYGGRGDRVPQQAGGARGATEGATPRPEDGNRQSKVSASGEYLTLTAGTVAVEGEPLRSGDPERCAPKIQRGRGQSAKKGLPMNPAATLAPPASGVEKGRTAGTVAVEGKPLQSGDPERCAPKIQRARGQSAKKGLPMNPAATLAPPASDVGSVAATFVATTGPEPTDVAGSGAGGTPVALTTEQARMLAVSTEGRGYPSMPPTAPPKKGRPPSTRVISSRQPCYAEIAAGRQVLEARRTSSPDYKCYEGAMRDGGVVFIRCNQTYIGVIVLEGPFGPFTSEDGSGVYYGAYRHGGPLLIANRLLVEELGVETEAAVASVSLELRAESAHQVLSRTLHRGQEPRDAMSTFLIRRVSTTGVVSDAYTMAPVVPVRIDAATKRRAEAQDSARPQP